MSQSEGLASGRVVQRIASNFNSHILGVSITSMQPRILYLICTLPRSGSWLLAEALHSTGIAGRPREYFAPEAKDSFTQQWRLPATSSYIDFIEAAMRTGTTSNGVFGAKTHW